jgi:hypothetical protein
VVLQLVHVIELKFVRVHIFHSETFGITYGANCHDNNFSGNRFRGYIVCWDTGIFSVKEAHALADRGGCICKKNPHQSQTR